jgi:hypothetical protein
LKTIPYKCMFWLNGSFFLGFLKEGAKTYLIAPLRRFFTRHLIICVHICSPWGNTRYGDCVLATATRHIRPFYAWVHAQLATLVRHGQLARASLEYRHFSSLTTHTGRRRHTATVTGQWARARREKCGVVDLWYPRRAGSTAATNDFCSLIALRKRIPIYDTFQVWQLWSSSSLRTSVTPRSWSIQWSRTNTSEPICNWFR